MTRPDAYVYSLDVLERDVDRVLKMYAADPEAAHAEEDRLLEQFVRDAAFESRADSVVHKKAMTLVALLDQQRVRWYA